MLPRLKASHQFFLRTTDADVERQLLSFTFLRVEDIQAIMVEHIVSSCSIFSRFYSSKISARTHLNGERPKSSSRTRSRAWSTVVRAPVSTLQGSQLTNPISTESGLDSAHTITKIIFAGGNYQSLKANDIIVAFKGDSRLAMVNETEMHSKNIGDLVVSHKLVQSKSTSSYLFSIRACLIRRVVEATRLASAKGLYLNNKIVGKTYNKITPDDLIDGRVAILRTGKSKHLILALEQ